MQLQWEGEETHPPRPAAAFVTAQPGPTRSGSGSAGARRRWEQMEPEGKAATPGRAERSRAGPPAGELRAGSAPRPPAESSAGLGLPRPAGRRGTSFFPLLPLFFFFSLLLLQQHACSQLKPLLSGARPWREAPRLQPGPGAPPLGSVPFFWGAPGVGGWRQAPQSLVPRRLTMPGDCTFV